MAQNSLAQKRELTGMSKAELARKAGVSPITIARIENGKPCRIETKREILAALGCKVSDVQMVFGDQS